MLLTKLELLKQLEEQLRALKFFAKEYDSGKHFLFKDMAVKLRILFQNSPSGRSKSLLNQLNLETLDFYDSAILVHELATNTIKAPIHFKFAVDIPLIFQPELLPGLFKNNFAEWWKMGPIVIDKNKKEFSRQDLVRYVTDNDGGAHVDEKLPEKYYELTRGSGSGWYCHKLKKNIDPVPAVIRQITHEVLQTFEEFKFDDQQTQSLI
jgi:hypothetical protein